MIFDAELCKRFVSDANLPIPVPNEEEKFWYYLDLYEGIYSSRTLYETLCNEIQDGHDGDVKAFLSDLYESRDNAITHILEHPKYKEFLNVDMKRYELYPKLRTTNVQKGNIYIGENVGKSFLSVDLSQANFQAMKYFSDEIVKDASTYEEFISQFTSSGFMRGSRYERQVIFGKCNAARQIAIEKHLLSKFYEELELDDKCCKLVRFNNDELIFEILDKGLLDGVYTEINKAAVKSGVQVKAKHFTLEGIYLHSKRKNEDRNLYFVEKFEDGSYKFKCIPLTYHSIVYKLYNGMELNKIDYYFRYEGLDAYIDDEFELRYYNI